jgi:6-pyruvoyltetrahydropterin/6-carboxytetrahydropterin synthase
MLADFGDLKKLLQYLVHDPLDHGTIAYAGDRDYLKSLGVIDKEGNITRTSIYSWKIVIMPFIPTAENLAIWVWNQLRDPVTDMGFKMQLVELWETPTSLATYNGS